MKRCFKEQKGITLAALVITIIVILILASVSVSMLTGDNGILTKAIEAKEQTEKASLVEDVQIAYLNALTGGTYNGETFKNALSKADIEAVTSIDTLPVTVKRKSQYVTIDEDGNAISVKWYLTDDNKVTDGKTTFELGDTINYDCGDIEDGANTTYVSLQSVNGEKDSEYELTKYTKGGSKELTWVILGVDKGQIMIIPTQNILANDTLGYLYLAGQAGYLNGISEMDNISKLYAQGKGADTEKSRSITVEDINKLTGYNPATDAKEQSEGEIDEYGARATYYWDGTAYPYYTISNGYVSPNNNKTGTKHTDGFYWVENGTLKCSNVSKTASTRNKEKITTIINTYYSYSHTESKYKNNVPEELYNVLFKIKDSYWLASSYENADLSGANYGFRYVYSSGIEGSWVYNSSNSDSACYYIRPVVYLDIDWQL